MMKFFTNSGVTINSASTISDVPVPSVIARFGTASIAGAAVTTSCTALMLNSFHDRPAEQPGRFDNQNSDDQRQRNRQLQFIADAGNVGTGEVFEDADQKPADDSAERAGQAAQHGGGEAVNQHAAHHVGLKKHHWRDQHAGN